VAQRCGQVIDAIEYLYAGLSAQGAKQPGRFAEKFTPAHLAPLVAKLWPRSRQVFLARDPRDVVVSRLEFDRKRGDEQFQSKAGDLAGMLDAVTRQMTSRLERAVALAPWSPLMVIRYEDLVRSTARTLGRLFAWLELDDDPSLLARIASQVASDEALTAKHMTAMSADASVGRWKGVLSDDMVTDVAPRLAALESRIGELSG
jgi:hypothetical protein